MTELPAQIGRARRKIKRAVKHASPIVARVARFGFAAKGFVYCIIGAMAGLAPIGVKSAHPTGTPGALGTLLRQPIGSVLLAIVAGGFFAFGAFELVRAVHDPEDAGRSPIGLAKRIVWLGNAMVNFALVAIAIGMMIGYRKAADDDRAVRDWTAWVLAYAFGRWLVAGIGAGVIGYGIQQIVAGLLGKLDKRLSFQDVNKSVKRWLRAISRFGVAARGGFFGFLGWLLIRAAYDAKASEAQGVGGTLRAIAAEPYGKWLLGLTAIGLLAYGIYDFVLARYRRIKV